MKMNQKLLLTASVFFVLLVLIGCGVATILLVDANISYNKTTNKYYIKITDPHDNLNEVDRNTGPSLFLAYVVTDEASLQNSSKITTKFNETYRRSPNGIHLGSSLGSSPVLTIDDPSIALYAFSDGVAPVAPNYHATADDPNFPNGIFTITQDDSSLEGGVVFILDFTTDGDAYTVYLNNLHRFNGQPFVIDATGEPDYSLQDPPFPGRYCHIFGSINIGSGDFNNIYWSEFSYLGSIELTNPE